MDNHLTGAWEEFEAWIEETIGANFHRRLRPQDNATNREMVASLILDGINRGGGIFPEKNTFIERG